MIMKLSSLNCARPTALDDKEILPPRPPKNMVHLMNKSRAGKGAGKGVTDIMCAGPRNIHVNKLTNCNNTISVTGPSLTAPCAPGYSDMGMIVNNPTVLSQTRDLLKGFILRKRSSLTDPEEEFLTSLANAGDEQEMNQAMKVLSDQELFFNPCQSPKSSLSTLLCRNHSDYESRCIDDEYTSPLRDIDIDDEDDDVRFVKSPHEMKVSMSSSGNVEIVDSGDGGGAIILQDIHGRNGDGIVTTSNINDGNNKRTMDGIDVIDKYSSPTNVSSDGDSDFTRMKNQDIFRTPVMDNRRKHPQRRGRSRTKTSPVTPGHGSSQRIARVLERKESGVHTSMWKAHNRGLSLTPVSSFRRTGSGMNSSRCSSLNSSPLVSRNTSLNGGNNESPASGGGNGNGAKVDPPVPMRWPTDEVDDSLSLGDDDKDDEDNEDTSITMSAIPGLDLAISLIEDKGSNYPTALQKSFSSYKFDSITHFPSLRRGGSNGNESFQKQPKRPSPLPPSNKKSLHVRRTSTSSLTPHDGRISPPVVLGVLKRVSITQRRSPLPPTSKKILRQSSNSSLASFRDIRSKSPPGSRSSSADPVHKKGSSITTKDNDISMDSNSHTNSNKSVKIVEPTPQSSNDNTPHSPRYHAPMRALRNPSPLESRQKVPRTDMPLRRPSPIPSTNSTSPPPPPPLPTPSSDVIDPFIDHGSSNGSSDDEADLSTDSNTAAEANNISSDSIVSQIDILEAMFSQDGAPIVKIEPRGAHILVRDSSLLETTSTSSGLQVLGTEVIDQSDISCGSSTTSGLSMNVEIAVTGEPECTESEGEAVVITEDGQDGEERGKTEVEQRDQSVDISQDVITTSVASNPGQSAFEISHIMEAMSHDTLPFHLREENENSNKAFNLDSLMDGDAMEEEEEDDDDIECVTQRYSYDAWKVLVDEYEKYGYGQGGFPFLILGTSADDEASMPHVLSPPLMESLYHFLPYSVSEENFYMKYSLLRDGASYFRMLQQIRASKHTIIALETTEGEVFGSFSSSPWRKNKTYFGSGEAFLWKMKKDRKTICNSVLDQALLESEIEVYAWTGKNYLTQYCTNGQIALGGEGNDSPGFESGFGLIIEEDLLNGSTGFCATFGNPPLSAHGQFEIVNLEIWTLTPAISEAEAEKLELGRLFLESNRLH